jgi:hypothetical protein
MDELKKIIEKGQNIDFDKITQLEKEKEEPKKINIDIEEIEDKYQEGDTGDAKLMMDIMNIHQIYYRTLYNKKNNETLFEEINYDDDTSTNRSMELFYEYMFDYKNNMIKGDDYVAVYTNDIIDNDKFDNLYGLIIDGDIKLVSPCIYSLYVYIVRDSNIKWMDNTKWKIIEVKSKEI